MGNHIRSKIVGSVLALGAGGLMVSTSTMPAYADSSVTITLWNRLEAAQYMWPTLIQQFEKANPNIKVDLQEVDPSNSTQQYNSAVSQNSLPDVFVEGGSYNVPELVNLNQLHALNDVLTPAVQKKYYSGIFANGFDMVSGNIYELPLYSGFHGTEMMFYNKDVMQKYGIKSPPKTWAQVLADGKRIYNKSSGKAFGFGMGLGSDQSTIILKMATAISPQVSSAPLGAGFNYKNGKYDFTTPGIIDTFNFFKTMLDDKVLDPDSLTSSGVQAQSLLATGKVAFIIDGNWDGNAINKLGFKNWGVAPIPTYKGRRAYQGTLGGATEALEVSAYTKHWPQVQTFLNYVVNHVYPMVAQLGATAPPVKGVLNHLKSPFPQYPNIVKLMNTSEVDLPNVYEKNSAAIPVIANLSTLVPQKTIGTELQGYLSGQISDITTDLNNLSEQYNHDLGQAISQSGGKVTMNDFVFKNWKPGKPYTAADYKHSGK